MPAFHWFCAICEGKAVKSINTDKGIEQRCSAFMQKMENMVKTVELELKSKVDKEQVIQVVRKEMQSTKAKQVLVPDLNPTIVQDMIAQEVEKRMQTTEDRESRKPNLILYNLPDDNKEVGEQKIADMNQVKKMISDHLKVKVQDPVDTHRLGISSKDKPRTLEVRMGSASDKIQIIKQAKKLKDAPEPLRSVSVVADMSIQDRQDHKNLLLEVRRLDDEDASGDFIHLVSGPSGRKQIIKERRRRR